MKMDLKLHRFLFLKRKLESEIIDLQKLVEVTGEQQCLDALKCKKSFLTDLLGIKTQGALVRSCYQMLTQMDVPSKHQILMASPLSFIRLFGE